MNFRTKRQSRPAPGVVYVPEEELPEDLRRARRSYLTAVERHTASVKAANVASKANTSKEKAKREDLQLAEIHDEQDQDTAYGYLARLAHAAGFRACLCGKIERGTPGPAQPAPAQEVRAATEYPSPDWTREQIEAWKYKQFEKRYGPAIDRELAKILGPK